MWKGCFGSLHIRSWPRCPTGTVLAALPFAFQAGLSCALVSDDDAAATRCDDDVDRLSCVLDTSSATAGLAGLLVFNGHGLVNYSIATAQSIDRQNVTRVDDQTTGPS